MAFIVWVVLGLAAGLLASKHFHHTAGALALDVILGVAGAVAGGFALDVLNLGPSAAFATVGGAIGAMVGAVVVLACYRAIFRPA